MSNNTPTAPSPHPDSDPFPDFDLFIPLTADSSDAAGFRIKNKPPGSSGTPETNRLHLTGYDRINATAVRGRLFHVVHGTTSDTNPRPASLLVFEWLLIPAKLGRRFRTVDIDITFAASGRRRGRDLAEYAPAVVAVAPDVPIESCVSSSEVTVETSVSAKITAGYPGIVSGGPEVGRRKTEVTRRRDYRFVGGYPTYVEKTYGEPNAVHWTLQENGSEESGLPGRVRTAVLLQHNVGDRKGMFSATIHASVKVSVLADGAESLRKLVGLIPKDDPVYFDPGAVHEVEHGAAVLYGSQDVADKKGPVDKNNLIKADLVKLVVLEGETDQSSGQSAAMELPEPKPAEPEGAPGYGVNMDVSLEL
ncbi:hypothetical protein B0T18DRAFT_423603 [Schizothecium vesticola]|uniref:Uncharacterized protein n=1 Tax=Schizothecium vesticola TaxID=314040 RepID=A0AA40KBE4_9PEZI|nr:hypothetical protein B0T18DRAFT_423603 [Schizothecium vesticola]